MTTSDGEDVETNLACQDLGEAILDNGTQASG
jgi:hypothetical protein